MDSVELITNSNNHNSPLEVEITQPQDVDDSASRKSRRRYNDVLSSSREAVGKFVNSNIIEGTILAMIIINGIMIGLSTFDFISENTQLSQTFETIDMVFLIIFTVELSLHMYHLGLFFFKDCWVLFDFFLIVFSWAFNTGSIKAIRALRILRVLPRIEALRHVIRSIVVVMPRMGAVGLLLSLILFIFSILMTQLFGNLYEEYGTEFDYFSTLDLTLLTLFQLMTLDGWTNVVREVGVVYTWAWVPLFLYIILTGIFVTNMVIAIICDSVLEISNQEEEDRAKDNLKEKTTKLLVKTMQLRNEIDKMVKSINMNNYQPNGASSRFLSQQSSLTLNNDNQVNALLEDISDHEAAPSDDKSSFSLNLPPGGLREKCGKFVESPPVQTFIITLIIINSIMMAISTFSFVVENPSTLATFDTVDTVFLCIYTVESMMQLFYRGKYIYKDGWSSFDLFLVVLSWSMAFTNIPVQAARSLRIIRILRLVPKLKSLRIIITAISSVLPKLGGITAILLLIYYIFAIILTVLFKDYELEEDYFSRLDSTMFTLFQIMTMADWSPIVRELMMHVEWAAIPIIVFLVVSGFIFLNLIIALVCEAMNFAEDLTEEEEEMTNSRVSLRTVSNDQQLKHIDDAQSAIIEILKSFDLVPKNRSTGHVNNPVPQNFEHSRNQSLLDLDEFLDANESFDDDSRLSESTGKD